MRIRQERKSKISWYYSESVLIDVENSISSVNKDGWAKHIEHRFSSSLVIDFDGWAKHVEHRFSFKSCDWFCLICLLQAMVETMSNLIAPENQESWTSILQVSIYIVTVLYIIWAV